MTPDSAVTEQGLLERFAQALARIVHDERPELVGRTITVAELYQEIAPYRRMRELAGFEIHADYEHALIRFLAGEGGYAQLDPETAADELGIEAESSDPDLSLYRKFAACDVRIAYGAPLPPRPPKPAPTVEPARPEPLPSISETLRALEPVETHRPPAAGGTAPRAAAAGAPAPHAGAASHAASAPSRTARCAYCGQPLPAGREVRFCPHCGVDQAARECGACGESLEDGWRFCVACGAAAGA